MARVRINKMTVPELVAYCKEQRQGESCLKDCALRKLGCDNCSPALWNIEAVRRDEQREDAVDMVRHLIAAYGLYPEDIFPELPEVEPPKDKRVPNRLKDAIGKEPSAAVPAVNLAEGELAQAEFISAEHVKSEGVPGRGEAPAGDETESEAATAAESAAAEPTDAPPLESEKNISNVQAAARAAGMSYGRYVSMQETAARILGKAEPADAEKNESEAEAILNAGKTQKRRGRPPRKAAE